MVVAHNITAMNNERQLNIVNGKVEKNTQKLTSGYRINYAADDAAGLSISEKMRKQIRGLDRAVQNAEEGISLIQTAEGALNEVHDMLQRMNELCIQAANGTNSETDRGYIQDEVKQLKSEIDRVATTVKFNDLYLLDGSLASTSGQADIEKEYQEYMEEAARGIAVVALNGEASGDTLTLADIDKQSGLKIVYTELKHDVETTQTQTGNATISGYDALKEDLKKEIVPQAVKALLETFPDTYGYLNGSSIGIGLELYSNSASTTLASVTIGVSGYLSALNVTYKLSVNTATLSFDASGNLTDESRNELENTIIHEMTHAMMDEALTAGMLGYNGGTGFDANLQFPGWFAEGMAQAAAGACFDGNDWVNVGLGITASTSISDISSIIRNSSNAIASDTTKARYATGYLACMYLGYLASGNASAMNTDASTAQKAIAVGIDKILSSIKSGESLDAVIADYTGYSGLSDFESRFGTTTAVTSGYDDAATFIHKLVSGVGSGSGGLTTGNYAGNDQLPDSAVTPEIKLFELDTDNDTINNVYPSGYDVLTGGTATTTGTPGLTGSGTGGTGGSGGTGGTGGNGGTGGTGGSGGTGSTGGGTEPYIPKTGLTLQIGAESQQRMRIYIEAMNVEAIGAKDVDVTTVEKATRSIDMVAFAIHRVSTQRAELGAYQNRLEHTVRNLNNVEENTQAAESQIRDTDMAEEMVEYSNNQVLQQAGQSVLAQANQANQGVISLLR